MNSFKKSLNITPYFSKDLKNITLSEYRYKKYISEYDKITKENCFKSPNNSCYPKRKNLQYINLSYIKKETKNKNKKQKLLKSFNH